MQRRSRGNCNVTNDFVSIPSAVLMPSLAGEGQMGFVDHRPWLHNQKLAKVERPEKVKQAWCQECYDNVINRVAPGISQITGRYICQLCEHREKLWLERRKQRIDRRRRRSVTT